MIGATQHTLATCQAVNMHTEGGFEIRRTTTGFGQVFIGAKLVGEVSYSLKEVSENLQYPFVSAPANQRLDNRNAVYGLLKTSKGTQLDSYIGTRLLLVLADQRKLEFTVCKHVRKASWLIQAFGELS